MPFYSPLRYPGGKRKLSSYIKLVFAENKLAGSHYIEPYAGGAAIALSLLFDGYASHVHINDLSRSVYAFWHAALRHTDSLCSRIRSTHITMDEWHRQHAIQERAHETRLLDLGFSTFFMNRTNRSGIIKGGVLGGKNQDGPYKLDARYNTADLIGRIKRVASYRDRISVYNEDAAHFITSTLLGLPTTALVYLDPPYWGKAKQLYENNYEFEDHRTIHDVAVEMAQKWIVSYNNVPGIREMYGAYRGVVYHLNYSAGRRYLGSEVMFFSNDLNMPCVDNPALVASRLVSQLRTDRRF